MYLMVITRENSDLRNRLYLRYGSCVSSKSLLLNGLHQGVLASVAIYRYNLLVPAI